jgi:hypothetical protein
MGQRDDEYTEIDAEVDAAFEALDSGAVSFADPADDIEAAEAAAFSAPSTPASLLLACLVDEVVFFPTSSGANYPSLVGARYEAPIPFEPSGPPREVTLNVATMIVVDVAGPVRVEIAILGAEAELMVNVFADLTPNAGYTVNVTPIRVMFDALGRYLLGVAVNGQRWFYPLVIVPEPARENGRENGRPKT